MDNSSSFASPELNQTTTSTSLISPIVLPDGKYYWRVRAINESLEEGPWSVVRAVTINSTLPAVTKLLTPKDHTFTSDTTPTFTWNAASGATRYQLQVSDNTNFSSPFLIDQPVSALTYTVKSPNPPLAYGVYYWRVQALDAADNGSGWSAINTLTVTLLKSPKNAQHLTDTTPLLTLAALSVPATYHIQVDEIDGDFTGELAFDYSGPLFSLSVDHPLAYGEYKWRAQVNGGAFTDFDPGTGHSPSPRR